MQIHGYSLTSKAGLINIIKHLYKQSSDYVSMLENIKTKVESDFTHTKLYDLKALLNDCNTFNYLYIIYMCVYIYIYT